LTFGLADSTSKFSGNTLLTGAAVRGAKSTPPNGFLLALRAYKHKRDIIIIIIIINLFG